ncbi:hypothetical protein F3J31_14875 [Enterobacter sp. Acro-832]|uniref:hypothetical protein n=1 Tax=Enterobacter sp. Acro-832 TaxID=2608348 RepID=UPI0014213B62|nr:hypothetical protein [Enterobacter sp. Acro-832]NIG45090.1 hypothetical protein [Enterobacter sp. Acro-832]
MTNHESIKLVMGFSLTVVTGIVFYIYKPIISLKVGAENYYLILAYAAVIPPFVLNKTYDAIIKKMQDVAQKKLALDIDENDKALDDESAEFKEMIKNHKNGTKEKIRKIKEIQESRKTL